MNTAASLSVLAVDDERPALEDLARLLRSSPWIAEVVCAHSGRETLRHLAERQFDALFLDVRMPGLGGLELAGVLDRFAHPPAVVFVSAYEDGAVRAFEVHAVDYLMKPVSKRRIEDAITRVTEVTGRNSARATLAPEHPPEELARDDVVAVERADGHATRIVSRASIRYVQARGDYVRIVSDDGRYMHRGTLADLERRWSAHGFHRVHRAYLVNLRHAVEMRPDLGGTAVLLLSDGSEIPVARRQVSELLHRLRM
jgi:two-component system, LytTR family, response regulator LytT